MCAHVCMHMCTVFSVYNVTILKTQLKHKSDTSSRLYLERARRMT